MTWLMALQESILSLSHNFMPAKVTGANDLRDRCVLKDKHDMEAGIDTARACMRAWVSGHAGVCMCAWQSVSVSVRVSVSE